MNQKRANETFLSHCFNKKPEEEAAWTHGGPKFSFGSRPQRKENMKEADDTKLYPMCNERAAAQPATPSGPTFGHRREVKMEKKPGPGQYRTLADDRAQWQAVSFKGRRTTVTGPRLGADSPGPASYNTSCSTIGVAGKGGCERLKGSKYGGLK
jgi:hypothetical protein